MIEDNNEQGKSIKDGFRDQRHTNIIFKLIT